MRVCVNCGTQQVQRIREGVWRTLCRCRHCRFEMYDTLSSAEYQGRLQVYEFLGTILSNFERNPWGRL